MKDNKVLLELARKTISAVSSVDAEFVETAPIGIVDFEKWEWTQGVGLFALWQYYKLSGDVSVRKKIEKWYSDRLCEGLPEKNVNTMCPLLTMLFLYEETGGEEFLPVLHEWAEYAMHSLPRTCEGGIQHSCTGSPNPGQIWDDTLYMTVLFLAKYGVLFGRDDCLEESVYQFLVHIKYLAHRRSGLWYHGWSFGRGDHFAGALWARGNSWITAGIPAFFEIARPQGAARRFIAEAYVRQAESLRSLQDASGLWHTLLDDPSSYLESSASANFAYGFLKGIRMGLLPAPFAESAEKAVQALISCIGPDGIVQNCSYGTGMGSTLQAYREIPVCPMPYGQTLTALGLMEYIKFSQTAPV